MCEITDSNAIFCPGVSCALDLCACVGWGHVGLPEDAVLMVDDTRYITGTASARLVSYSGTSSPCKRSAIGFRSLQTTKLNFFFGQRDSSS